MFGWYGSGEWWVLGKYWDEGLTATYIHSNFPTCLHGELMYVKWQHVVRWCSRWLLIHVHYLKYSSFSYQLCSVIRFIVSFYRIVTVTSKLFPSVSRATLFPNKTSSAASPCLHVWIDNIHSSTELGSRLYILWEHFIIYATSTLRLCFSSRFLVHFVIIYGDKLWVLAEWK